MAPWTCSQNRALGAGKATQVRPYEEYGLSHNMRFAEHDIRTGALLGYCKSVLGILAQLVLLWLVFLCSDTRSLPRIFAPCRTVPCRFAPHGSVPLCSPPRCIAPNCIAPVRESAARHRIAPQAASCAVPCGPGPLGALLCRTAAPYPTAHPAPYILHATPHTLHRTTCTLHHSTTAPPHPPSRPTLHDLQPAQAPQAALRPGIPSLPVAARDQEPALLLHKSRVVYVYIYIYIYTCI